MSSWQKESVIIRKVRISDANVRMCRCTGYGKTVQRSEKHKKYTYTHTHTSIGALNPKWKRKKKKCSFKYPKIVRCACIGCWKLIQVHSSHWKRSIQLCACVCWIFTIFTLQCSYIVRIDNKIYEVYGFVHEIFNSFFFVAVAVAVASNVSLTSSANIYALCERFFSVSSLCAFCICLNCGQSKRFFKRSHSISAI